MQTIASQLDAALAGRRLDAFELALPGWLHCGEPARVEGARLREVSRWGKRLRLCFANQAVMVVSLGMTGNARLHPASAPHPRHLVARLSFQGQVLDFTDPRKFGCGHLFASQQEAEARLGDRIGQDAAGAFDWRTLRAHLGQGKLAVKAALLDQSRLAGIGNYLADEMLFAAGIHPQRPLSSLSDEDWRRLNRSRRAVIRRALKARGLSFSDYRDAEGRRGTMSRHLRVYGRAGLPCTRCKTTLVKLSVAGRGTTICPSCQD